MWEVMGRTFILWHWGQTTVLTLCKNNVVSKLRPVPNYYYLPNNLPTIPIKPPAPPVLPRADSSKEPPELALSIS